MFQFDKQDTLIFSECQIWSSTHRLTPWYFTFPFSCFKHIWIFKSSCLAHFLILFWNCLNWILRFIEPNSLIFSALPNLIINKWLTSSSLPWLVCSQFVHSERSYCLTPMYLEKGSTRSCPSSVHNAAARIMTQTPDIVCTDWYATHLYVYA